MRRFLTLAVLLTVLLSVSQMADGRRRRVRVRKPKVTATQDIIRKVELKTFAPLIFGADSVVMDSPLRTMNEMGQESGAMIYVCTLPEVKAASTLTMASCHDYAKVFVDDELIGQTDRSKLTLELPSVHDGQELKIQVDAVGRKNADDFVGLAEPITLTADLDGHELTLNLRRWTILTIPDDYDTATKALETVAADSLALPDTSGEPGYYRYLAMFSRDGDIYLNMENFGRGQVFVNGNSLGYFSNTKSSLQVLRRYLKRGFNEVVVFDVAGPRQAVLSAQDQPAVGQ